MSEHGGTTTQSGIYYQNSITALYLGQLCDSAERPSSEQVIKVRSETLDHVDDTVVTFADGHYEYIQAKENIKKTDQSWAKLWTDFEKQFDSQDFEQGRDKLVLQIGNPRNEHNLLMEMCDRASTSESLEEWLERLSKEQTDLLKKIGTHLLEHKSDKEYLFSLLKHLRVSIFSIYEIEKNLIYHRLSKSNRAPIELFRLLRDRVGGEARLRGSFTTTKLIENLKNESNIEFFVPPTIDELNDIASQCGAGLRQHKSTFGNTDIRLDREITDEIIDWVKESTLKNVAVILNQAGMGKTVVMRSVLEKLDDQNVSVLALKADQISGTKNKEDFQDKLGLPDNIERILTRLATTKKTVFIIDQIDALSLSLAHDQTTLDVLLDIIARTRHIKNLKIIISCRTFDFNNDPRLAKIEIDRKFSINKLTGDEVKSVVEKVGLSIDNFSPATKELLKIPLHLNLLILSLTQEDEVDNFYPINAFKDLTSLQDLYSLIWQTIIAKTDLGAPSKSAREIVIESITDEMDRKQQVSVHKTFITKSEDEELVVAADWLASHGILVPYKNQWNLIHQTFFDYCYAKSFVENDKKLYESVVESNQGLFIRPQIIQVMNYLRGVDFNAYLREISQFLSKDEIRFHLRDYVLRWFTALPDPTDEEWTIARRLMQIHEKRKRVISFMFGNNGWFEYLQPNFVKLLNSQDDETLDNETIPFLSSFIESNQSEVVTILKPYLAKGEKWNNRIHSALSSIREWREPEAVNLFEEYLKTTSTFNKVDYFELENIAEFDLRAACRCIVRLLDIIVDQIINNLPQDGIKYIYSIDSKLEVLNGTPIIEILDSLVENEAEYFLEQIFPWVEKVLSLGNPNAKDTFPYFKSDPISPFWDQTTYVVRYKLIQTIIQALVNIAISDRENFLQIIEKLAKIEYQSPQRLITRTFTKVPKQYVNEAFNFLIADNKRLYLGENEVFDSRKLVEAISPFLTDEQMREIEKSIFALFQIGKFRTKNDFYFLHRNQMFLFQSLPISKISSEVQKRLAELERRFPNAKASEKSPSRLMFGHVGSPISSEAIEKMSDEDWLSAMKKYEKGVKHRESFKGGAGSLASLLSQQINDEPERFYNLALRTPIEVDVAYASAFINGLTDSEIQSEKVFDVVRHFSNVIGKDHIRNVARALEKKAEENFPNDLLEKLERFLQLPIGEDETWWQKQEDDQQKQGYYDGLNQGPYMSYLNSDRGSAFRAIMRVLDGHKKSDSTDKKWSLIEFAKSDESVALKAGAIEELMYMISVDLQRSVNLFLELTNQHKSLLNMRYSLDFMYYVLPAHYDELKPLLLQAMEEKYESTQQRAAELFCIVFLYPPELENTDALADVNKIKNSILTEKTTWKRGAANVYAGNTDRPEHTEVCLENLTELLNESDKDIKRTIANVFGRLNEETFPKSKDFISEYSKIDLSMSGEHTFTEFLWEHGILDPEWSISIVNSILENRYNQDVRPYHRAGERLIRLIMRIYSDPSLPSDVTESALNTFDTLMKVFPGDVNKILGEWDRR